MPVLAGLLCYMSVPPSGWKKVNKVKISEVTMEGLKEIGETGVANHTVTLSLGRTGKC